MTEPIKLAELRDSLETCAPLAPQFAAEVLALIDAVEAAHRANFDAPCEWCSTDGVTHDDDCANVKLTAALMRFDFSEPA